MNTREAFLVAIILFTVAIYAAAFLDWLTAIVLLAMGWAALAVAIRATMRGDRDD